jgi:hypothetical protein
VGRILGAMFTFLLSRRAQTDERAGTKRLIISPSMLPAADGDNINGPSLIRVPDWVPGRLGRYYLYFAHHHGTYIRLAYADDLLGEWTILPGGCLRLSEVPNVCGHIASPDVHVDDEARRIRLYFHGCCVAKNRRQRSFVALSEDGIHFAGNGAELGPSYFRVFRHDGWWYAISKGGLVHRSSDGLSDFITGRSCDARVAAEAREPFDSRGSLRHVAVQKCDGRLAVYFSRIGDRPERIMRAWIDLAADWTQWSLGSSDEIVRPTRDFEGARLPLRRSRPGPSRGLENALRDPAVFVDDGGKAYLLYSVMGERGIAMAELVA